MRHISIIPARESSGGFCGPEPRILKGVWVFRNDSFVSIVQHRDESGWLLVRARIEGDIERFFGPLLIREGAIFEDASADYRYRFIVPRETVSAALHEALGEISYHNFKESIAKKDVKRKAAYMDVWGAMARFFGAYVGRKS